MMIFLLVFELGDFWIQSLYSYSPCLRMSYPLETLNKYVRTSMDIWGHWPGGRGYGCWEAVKEVKILLLLDPLLCLFFQMGSILLTSLTVIVDIYVYLSTIKLATHPFINTCVFKSSIIHQQPQCLLSMVNTLVGYLLSEKLHLCCLSQSWGCYHLLSGISLWEALGSWLLVFSVFRFSW